MSIAEVFIKECARLGKMLVDARKENKRMSRNERRKNNYNFLRECGFNSSMANKYKDLTQNKLDELCKIIKESNESKSELEKIVALRFYEVLKKA